MVSALFRQWSALTLAALALAAWRSRLGAALRDLKCTGNPEHPWAEQIGGCTPAIGSGHYSGTDLAQALNNRGTASMGTGDLGNGVADFNRAIASLPIAPSLTTAAASLTRPRTIRPRARRLTQAIRLAPSDALAFNNRGLLYARHQDFDRAIADMTRRSGSSRIRHCLHQPRQCLRR